MPTQDGTTVARDRELNRIAAAESRKRKRINEQTTDLVVQTLYRALSSLTQQVIQAANSSDPQAALLSFVATLPSQETLADKQELL